MNSTSQFRINYREDVLTLATYFFTISYVFTIKFKVRKVRISAILSISMPRTCLRRWWGGGGAQGGTQDPDEMKRPPFFAYTHVAECVDLKHRGKLSKAN